MRKLLFIAAFLLPSTASAWVIQHTMTAAEVDDSCGSANFATDTFTEGGSGNVELNTHTKDSGGSWSDPAYETRRVHIDRTNDVILSTATGGNGSQAVINDTVTCYNYVSSMTARTGTTGSNRIGPLVRFDISTGNGYWYRLTGGGDVEIWTMVSGSASSMIGSADVATLLGSFNTATNYNLRIEVNGSQLTAYINDTEAIDVADATYATGKPGVMITGTAPRSTDYAATFLP